MKTTPGNFSLTRGQLQFLAAAVREDKASVTSVFRCEKPGTLTAKERKELQEKKYMNANGQPADALHRVLEILVASDAYAWIGYEGSRLLQSTAVYHAGAHRVLLQEIPEGVRLVSPPPATAVFDLLGHHLGVSPFRAITLDVVLDEVDSLVFAALVDLRRRELLGALLDRRSETAGVMPVSAVADWIAAKDPGAQWLTSRLRQFLALKTTPDAAAVQAGVDRLVAKGYATAPWTGRVCPTEKIDLVARQLILLSNRILLSAASLSADGKNSIAVALEAFQSGVTGLILLEKTGPNSVHFAGLSPQMLLAIAAQLFETPRRLRELESHAFSAAATMTGSETTGSVACPACSGPNAADAKFCSHCGKPLGRHCAQCGAPVEADYHFCSVCGGPVAAAATREKT